jgi:phospholipase C
MVNDPTDSFCIDTSHIAPLSTYYSDLTNGTLPSFAFIEAGYGNSDEHPGSGQSILSGQIQVAKVINAFMASPEWNNSVFFLSYDEGGGPYDHVPPVPGHSNDNTDPTLQAVTPDIDQIAVAADGYAPCVPTGGVPSLHCDLFADDPGANAGDAAAAGEQGFAAQLGFRVPNIIISPFTRKHYVSHTPMDHTAVIKFVENRFIGPAAHLTARDAAQPNLLEFFDFTNIPWATPPTPPVPFSSTSTCTPISMGP